MVENMAKGQVDGFCAGAPSNAVAADSGIGVILHPGCAIFNPAPEKTLALRQAVAEVQPEVVEALIRACLNAADFLASPQNRSEVAAILARPDRVGVDAPVPQRTLEGRLGSNIDYENTDYLIIGDRVSGRPESCQAAWVYAQMLRGGGRRASLMRG